jgi:UDP-N-acetyl-D-glucosamine dehydrogenase
MRISVVGLGYVGLPLAIECAKSGYQVNGIDVDSKLISKLNDKEFFSNFAFKNKFKRNVDISFHSQYIHLNNSDVILICLPTPLTSHGKPDLKILNESFSKIKKFVKPKTLIILESTVNPGLTRSLEKLFPKCDIAFSPERIDPLNQKWDVKNTPKLVAGLTDKARDRAVEFYSKFIDTVIPCSSLEVAETAKLLENSFRLINISFINELAIFCNKIGIDVQEVIKAASTKPYGFMPFYPSVGIGGHCIPVDPVYLSHKAKEVGAPTSFIDLATKVNHEMPKYFVKRASQMLGKVKNKKVLVLGVSYKPNISDVRETPVEALIDVLRKKGAKVKQLLPLHMIILT